jgi:hypothetical protein
MPVRDGRMQTVPDGYGKFLHDNDLAPRAPALLRSGASRVPAVRSAPWRVGESSPGRFNGPGTQAGPTGLDAEALASTMGFPVDPPCPRRIVRRWKWLTYRV